MEEGSWESQEEDTQYQISQWCYELTTYQLQYTKLHAALVPTVFWYAKTSIHKSIYIFPSQWRREHIISPITPSHCFVHTITPHILLCVFPISMTIWFASLLLSLWHQSLGKGVILSSIYTCLVICKLSTFIYSFKFSQCWHHSHSVILKTRHLSPPP